MATPADDAPVSGAPVRANAPSRAVADRVAVETGSPGPGQLGFGSAANDTKELQGGRWRARRLRWSRASDLGMCCVLLAPADPRHTGNSAFPAHKRWASRVGRHSGDALGVDLVGRPTWWADLRHSGDSRHPGPLLRSFLLLALERA